MAKLRVYLVLLDTGNNLAVTWGDAEDREAQQIYATTNKQEADDFCLHMTTTFKKDYVVQHTDVAVG